MLRWAIPTVAVSVLGGGALYWMTQRVDPAAANADGSISGLTSALERHASEEIATLRFDDLSAASGINMRHAPFMRSSLLPEDMGSGAAFGDADGDGDIDLFLGNFGGALGGEITGRCAYYANDGTGHFIDASAEVGLDLAVRALGAAWADHDGDGDLDLFVSCFGPDHLMRQDANGRFTDIAVTAGVAHEGFSSGASWADYDHDGDLDLYVCRYVEFKHDPAEGAALASRQYDTELPYTLNPSAYPAARNSLYRNDGDGTFTDVAEAAGVADPSGRSLAASWTDFDDDGWLDLYVANDVSSNGVFRNRGDGTFADIGASSLAADYRGAMGLAIGDVDGDQDQDIFVTHWLAQENALFQNMWSNGLRDGAGHRRILFMDTAEVMGLGHASLNMVGWATGFVDFDSDGLLDLWVVNGNTLEDESDHSQLRPQRAQVFRQVAGRGFYEVGQAAAAASASTAASSASAATAASCPTLARPFVGRGGAMADVDGDGRVDLLFMRHGGTPLLLRNTTPAAGHWLRVALRDDRPGAMNRHGVGARVVVLAAAIDGTDRREFMSMVGAEPSYLSQSEPTLHFGIGPRDRIDQVLVRWPDGAEEAFTGIDADSLVTLRRGEGSTPPSTPDPIAPTL